MLLISNAPKFVKNIKKNQHSTLDSANKRAIIKYIRNEIKIQVKYIGIFFTIVLAL